MIFSVGLPGDKAFCKENTELHNNWVQAYIYRSIFDVDLVAYILNWLDFLVLQNLKGTHICW